MVDNWNHEYIEAHVEKTENRDPRKQPDSIFTYIDVSSVDNKLFRINKASEVIGSKAPSRARKVVRSRDVIYATVRPTLKRVAYITPEYDNQICSTGFCVLRTKKSLDSKFLYFWLLTDEVTKRVESSQRGANYPAVRDTDVKKLPIPIPPLSEQLKISMVLLTVLMAIQQQAQIIALTAELKKALMKKLFSKGTRGEPQKQTEIGRVPESWDVIPIGKYAKVLNGYAFKSKDYVKKGVRLIRISNVSFGYLISKDDKFLPKSYLDKYSVYSLKEGDLILSLTRPIVKGGMKYCFVNDDDLPALLNQRVGRFEVTHTKLQKDYLYHIIFSPYFINPLKIMAEGSNQPNVSPTRLESFKIPIPNSSDEQQLIAEILTLVTRKSEIAQKKANSLKELFRTLLNKLMTAQISVNGIELSKLNLI